MELGSFIDIGALFAIATAVSLIMRFLKQPLIIGHIITGILVGKFAAGLFENSESLKLFSHLGIAFLLFSVGLGLNPKVLKEFGMVSVLNTIGQVFLTGGAGVAVCLLLGLDWIAALYVGVAISFSSTVIVFKLLADKGDLDKLYVKISIGSLLLQDLVAILLLFLIPLVTGSSGLGLDLARTVGLGLLAGISVFFVASQIISRLHPYLTRSQELLFLFANAWAIGIAILFHKIGLSLEGGALIAGVALSSLPSSHEISARLTPLRDFFIVAFFILLGSQMVVGDLTAILVPGIILSLFVLIVNPLIQLIIMGLLGYRKKTSFQTGMMAAQISEFSLILVGLGVTLNQVDETILSTVTFVGIVTIFISTYLILYSDKIYPFFARFLSLFERKRVREEAISSERFSLILIGGGRLGYDFLKDFQHSEKPFLAIEHDPEVLPFLQKEGVSVRFGDAGDPDFLEELKLNQAELIVSTVPDLATNLLILSAAKKGQGSPLVFCVTHRINNALELYKAGADYVILPHFLGGKHAAGLLKRHSKGLIQLSTIREKHIAQLLERLHKFGHEHPQIERFR